MSQCSVVVGGDFTAADVCSDVIQPSDSKGGATWRQQFQDNAYTLTKNGTGGNEMTIIAGSGDTTIRGRLYTAGPNLRLGV